MNRSTFYFEPAAESEENLELMRAIDQQYLETPFFGRRQMTRFLRTKDWDVSEKRVGRLMRLMGLRGLAPGPPKTSEPHPDHLVFPYLLRDLVIDRRKRLGNYTPPTPLLPRRCSRPARLRRPASLIRGRVRRPRRAA